MKMKKRKAETLIEVVVAMAIFGVIMSGIADFMAEQTKNIARLIDKDEMIYFAQLYVSKQSKSEYNDGRVTIKSADNILTVTKGAETLTFNLKP